MNNHQIFHYLVGECTMFCQCIEYDIKLIYAKKLEGDFKQNFDLIKKETLGSVIFGLKEIDLSSDKSFFSLNDYEKLGEITRLRNYWVHQGYCDYVYSASKQSFEKSFDIQFQKLKTDHNKLKQLHETTQKIRREFFTKKK